MTRVGCCSKNSGVGRRRIRLTVAAAAGATLCAVASAPLAAAAGPPPPILIGGPSLAAFGSTYTLTGESGTLDGRHFTGTVVVRGSWNGGRWTTLARRHTDALGEYRLTIVLNRHGTLRLRVLMPHGELATKTLHVS